MKFYLAFFFTLLITNTQTIRFDWQFESQAFNKTLLLFSNMLPVNNCYHLVDSNYSNFSTQLNTKSDVVCNSLSASLISQNLLSQILLNNSKFYIRLIASNFSHFISEFSFNLVLFFSEELKAYSDKLNFQNQNTNSPRIENDPDAQIIFLEEKIKQQQTIFYLSFVGFISIVLILLLVYKKTRNRKLIAEKNITIQAQENLRLSHKQEIKEVDSIIKGQNIERKRIANDLHDLVGGNLASINAYFSVLEQQFSKQEQREIFNQTYKLLRQTYKDIRLLVHNNYNDLTEEQTLIHLLNVQKQTLMQLHDVIVILHTFNAEKELPSLLKISLFRFVQEISTNTIKHAEATQLDITLNVYDSYVNMIIEDDGKGFSPESDLTYGIGLKSIRERVENLNGYFEIDSELGRGSTFIISINYD